ncbi:hypothetical protein ACF0H5_004855 [Mactra antiquata]
MRTLILLVACIILGASALPSYKPKGASRSRDLEKLFDLFVRNSLLVRTPNATVDEPDDDDDFDCDDSISPCTGEGDAFFACAFDRLRDTEEDLRELFRNTFHEEIFRDEEMDIVWELRSDWKLSIEMKEIFEVIFMEIAEARATKFDLENADDSFRNSLNDLICDYIWLRERTFENGKYYHDADDK